MTVPRTCTGVPSCTDVVDNEAEMVVGRGCTTNFTSGLTTDPPFKRTRSV